MSLFSRSFGWIHRTSVDSKIGIVFELPQGVVPLAISEKCCLTLRSVVLCTRLDVGAVLGEIRCIRGTRDVGEEDAAGRIRRAVRLTRAEPKIFFLCLVRPAKGVAQSSNSYLSDGFAADTRILDGIVAGNVHLQLSEKRGVFFDSEVDRLWRSVTIETEIQTVIS